MCNSLKLVESLEQGARADPVVDLVCEITYKEY